MRSKTPFLFALMLVVVAVGGCARSREGSPPPASETTALAPSGVSGAKVVEQTPPATRSTAGDQPPAEGKTGAQTPAKQPQAPPSSSSPSGQSARNAGPGASVPPPKAPTGPPRAQAQPTAPTRPAKPSSASKSAEAASSSSRPRGATAPPSPPSPRQGTGFFERLDTNRDGVLTRSELPPQTADVMMQADANKDGKVTPQELRKATQEFAKSRGDRAGQGSGGFLQRLDANKDGVLTREELPEQTAAAMMQADADKDGKLSPEELRRGARAARRGQGRGRWFERFDANGDGVLTQNELPPQSVDRIMAADRNGDGKVTREEMQEARARWRSEAGGSAPSDRSQSGGESRP